MPDRPCILIVDDDRDIARGMGARLKATGFDILTEHGGKAGLATAETSLPDAIILDIRMPDLDGLTVLERLKRNEKTRRIPAIIVSASLVDQRLSHDLGASFFMQKPYDAKKLILALQSMLGSNANIGKTQNAN